jgi:predicted metalloprotease
VFPFPHGEAGDYGVRALFSPDVEVTERRAARPPRTAFPSRRRAMRMLRSIERVWQPLFEQAGARYEPAKLEPVDAQPHEACDRPGDWTGLYCFEERTIHLDPQLAGRAWPYVLAHEVGHHVQELRGVFEATEDEFRWHPRTSQDVSRRQELQAECFAGIWAHAARAPLPPRAFFDEEEVGTPYEHELWFRRGRRTGRPAACDTFRDPRS